MYDRRKTIGASDAVHIAKGDWQLLYDHKQGTEDTEYLLAASIGKALEPFHRDYYTQQTGIQPHHDHKWADNPFVLNHLTHAPSTTTKHIKFKWCTYTPDGLIETVNGSKTPSIPWEGKAINMMWKPQNLIAKYNPQLQHAMRVMHADYSILSVLYLNTRWEEYKIDYDPPYDNKLWKWEQAFYWHLENKIRP